MKQHSDLPYLQHILDAMDRIEQYMQGLDRATFDKNLLVQDGVIRQLMVLAKRLNYFPMIYVPSTLTSPGAA